MLAAGLAVGMIASAVMAFSQKQAPAAQPREVIIVARETAFHEASQPRGANPTLVFKKGQPVKLVVRNEERGQVLHCFIIGGLNVKTSRSLAGGESEALPFTPKQKGDFVYACLMHPGMSGKVIVR